MVSPKVMACRQCSQWTVSNCSPLAFTKSRIVRTPYQSTLSRTSSFFPAPFHCSKWSTSSNLFFSEDENDYSSHLPYEILPFQEVVNVLCGKNPPLSTDDYLRRGLSNEQARRLIAKIGPNSLQPPRKKSFWDLFLKQFDDGLVKVLMAVAAVSTAFSISEIWNVFAANVSGDKEVLKIGIFSLAADIVHEYTNNSEFRSTIIKTLVEPFTIVAILVLNAMVGVWQDLSARSSLEAVDKMQPRVATVLRYDESDETYTENSSTSKWITQYDATMLVPGDVIQFRVGDSIPADARLASMTSSTVYVNESSLTGESQSVGKYSKDQSLTIHDMPNIIDITVNRSIECVNSTSNAIPIQDQSAMLFSGSLVTRGSGTALVVRTGQATQMGIIQSILSEARSEAEERNTPLGEQLDKFGTTLSYIIGFICIIVWLASIPRFSDSVFSSRLEGAIFYAKTAVALGVAAIPEGLPAVITLCLSLGTRRMAGRNVIIKNLSSVETLGCTSVICTDKTGTLTSNQMTGVSILLLESSAQEDNITVVDHEITGTSYSPSGLVIGIDREETQKIPEGAVRYACDIMALCNDARLIGNDDFIYSSPKSGVDKCSGRTESTMQYSIEGEPTEAALLVLVEKLGPFESPREGARGQNVWPSLSATQNNQFFSNNWYRYATLEFDRQRKSMSVLCASKDTIRKRNKLFVKGAPSIILGRCKYVKCRDGKILSLTPELRSQIVRSITSTGERALRCISLAFKDGEHIEPQLWSENQEFNEYLKDSSKFVSVENDMTFVGMVAIKDPPRQGVADSILHCKQAGIKIIMITGDAKETASAIAKDVNIFKVYDAINHTAAAQIFEGREFFALPEYQQLAALKSENLVICRAEPADKQRLVKMLQTLGEVTAMTGDGVNDAPALQQATIGVAMGVSGTDVAKEASDMILADDNFSTIVHAIEEGRCIYANMQAFINFLITCNMGEVMAVLFATILGFPPLFTPLQLLWVNLVTDGPPATALGFNPPDAGLMRQKPRQSSEELLTSSMMFRYTVVGLYIAFATIGIYVSYFVTQGVSLHDLSVWSSCVDSLSCAIFTDLRIPQTLALTTLITTELLKALCSVSINSSIFTVGPQNNPWLILGVLFPFTLNLAILYNPVLSENFGLIPLSYDDWVQVFLWSFPIIFVDEMLKHANKSLTKKDIINELI